MTGPTWRKSRRCVSGECCWITGTADVVILAEQPNLDGPHLTLTRPDWRAFLDDLRDGAFDGPAT